jgi:hypothetical protein
MGILAPTDLRQWPSESEYMPLLRSLADRAARVAINMALLTELFVAPATPVRLMTDAYKEQGRAKRRRRFQLGQCLAAAKAPSPLRSAGALHKMPASRLVVLARNALPPRVIETGQCRYDSSERSAFSFAIGGKAVGSVPLMDL